LRRSTFRLGASRCPLHHRYRSGNYETWKYHSEAAWSRKTGEYGTWGGELRERFEPKPREIVAQEHWCSSGFANTDLDLQLKKHGIHQLIVIGSSHTRASKQQFDMPLAWL
jgi:ureidoacrylate peracid hydrolase